MLNRATGECSVRIRYSEPDQGYSQSYAAPQTQQGGYRKLQESYGGEEVPEDDGLIDTSHNRLNRSGKIALWVGFGILFLSACYYLRVGQGLAALAEQNNQVTGFSPKMGESIFNFQSSACTIAGFVCLTASLAYLMMATGHGFYVQCFSGRSFFYARYVDWIITTPLLIHALCHFANAPEEQWSLMVFMDVIMIVAGLIGSTVSGSERWIYFGFGCLALIPVLYYLCKLRSQKIDNRPYDPSTGMIKVSGTDPKVHLPYIWFFHCYDRLAVLTTFLWFLYPIVWACAEGTGRLSVDGEAIVYAVLDVLAKALFGWLICTTEIRDQKDIEASSQPVVQEPWL